MKNLSFLLLFVTFFCSSAFAQKMVAVLEIDRHPDVVNEISRSEAMEITGVIRSEAIRTLPTAKFGVMTSETVMSMSGAVLADCADENCIITIGRRIDADYVVRGSIRKFQTMFTLNVEMFETEYGNLVATADPVRSDNLMDILNKSAPACADIVQDIYGENRERPKICVNLIPWVILSNPPKEVCHTALKAKPAIHPCLFILKINRT